MGVKNITNINACTATDIIDYFRDIIGNDLENIIYKLYDVRMQNEDKKSIDDIVKRMNLTDKDEIQRTRSKLAYNLLQQSLYNRDYSIKMKILYQIYVRHYEALAKPENLKRLKQLKEIILENTDVRVLSNHVNERKFQYDIITREEPKSVENMRNVEIKRLVNIAFNSTVYLYDLSDFCRYEMLANIIMRKCLIDFYYAEGVNAEDIEQVVQDPVFNSDILNTEKLNKFLDYDEQKIRLFNLHVTEFLKKNLQLIDVDKLLISSATRVILGIRINNGEDINDIDDIIKNSIKYVKDIHTELSKKVKNKYGDDLTYIEEFLARCIEGKYYSDEAIKQIHEQIKQGILPEDLRVRQIANININDLINASRSYEDITDDEDAKAKLLSCSLDIIKYLRETGTISNDEQILDLYLNGDLHIDMVQETEMPEISEENYIEKFKSIYEQIPQDEEGINRKRLMRYSELYKRLASAGKIDIENLTEKLLEEYDDGNLILSDLYGLGLTDLKYCMTWNGVDFLKYLYAIENKNIQPKQINEWFYEQEDNKKLILGQLANLIRSIPTIEERYITVTSIFPDSESFEQQFLIAKTINVEKSLSEKSKSNNGKPINPIVEPIGGKESNKHLTYSADRFNLIQLFDKNHFFEMTVDGHAIIRWPRFKKVVIEKMLDKNNQQGYGAATYIVDEDYYLANEHKIRVDNKISRKELIKALKIDRADRISHIVEDEKEKRLSWGEKLKRYCQELAESMYKDTGLAESRYTEEEEKAIDTAIGKIKNIPKEK